MKNFMKTTTIAFLLIFAGNAQAQFTFSVSPGLHLNGATFGYRAKNFVPFIGFQTLGTKMNWSESGQRFDNDLGQIVFYEDKYEAQVRASIPTIGIKYFFGKGDKLKSYGSICYSKVFLSGKVSDNTDPNANEEFQKSLKETNINGVQLGYGAEYFISDQFSLSGEFGFRIISGKNSSERIVDVYDPSQSTYIQSKRTTKQSAAISPTYTKLSFNFYFNE
ncbi:MAG: hypothetical protein KG003_15860 [Bacteroidetes bacterium]|nr:hypothetical protein [Bacteroidota bacterium]